MSHQIFCYNSNFGIWEFYIRKIQRFESIVPNKQPWNSKMDRLFITSIMKLAIMIFVILSVYWEHYPNRQTCFSTERRNFTVFPHRFYFLTVIFLTIFISFWHFQNVLFLFFRFSEFSVKQFSLLKIIRLFDTFPCQIYIFISLDPQR